MSMSTLCYGRLNILYVGKGWLKKNIWGVKGHGHGLEGLFCTNGKKTASAKGDVVRYFTLS